MTRTTASALAPALILCCVDFRYIQAIQKLVKRRFHVRWYSLKTDAGGARALLHGSQAVRRWIWRNISLAYERQGVRRVFLFHHQDCLLYGGSAAFDGPKEEAALHLRELKQAVKLLNAAFRDIDIKAFYAHHTPRGVAFRPLPSDSRLLCDFAADSA